MNLSGTAAFWVFASVAALALGAAGLTFWGKRGVDSARLNFAGNCLAGTLAALGAHSGYIAFLQWTADRSGVEGAPLSMTLAGLVLIAPGIALTTGALLARGPFPRIGSVAGDSVAYALIFGLAMAAVSPAIGRDPAILIALLAVFLFIVPITRAFWKWRFARARYPEIRNTPVAAATHVLLFAPGALPLAAFARVCGLGADATQLAFGAAFACLAVAPSAALLLAVRLCGKVEPPPSEPAAEAPAAQVASAGAEAEPADPGASEDRPDSQAVAAASAAEASGLSQVVPFESEDGAVRADTTAARSARRAAPSSPPSRSGPKTPPPPKKPKRGGDGGERPASNAPGAVKPPPKPRKRI